MKTIVFFNTKGGVGITSLVYHLAWMYADLGTNVIAADFDPQANLTSMFLDDDRLAEIWEHRSGGTVYDAMTPLLEGASDVASDPHVEEIADGLGLLVGDLRLSAAEDELSSQWPDCLDGKPRAFRVISALWRILYKVSAAREPAVVLIDVGPNLGALNRAALVASDNVVIPLAPDLYSLQGLRNLGPALRRWRKEWADRRDRNPVADLELPAGEMQPAGYVVMQHAVRLDRPVQAYARWMVRIPGEYWTAILGATAPPGASIDTDPHCLATLKRYRSLMPLAQEARKPMFFLKPADGAIGGHTAAVQDCYRDFRRLAAAIADRCGVSVPSSTRG